MCVIAICLIIIISTTLAIFRLFPAGFSNVPTTYLMYDLTQEIPSLSLDATYGVDSIRGPPQSLPTLDSSLRSELRYFPFGDDRIPTPFHVNTRFPSSPLKQFERAAMKMREVRLGKN